MLFSEIRIKSNFKCFTKSKKNVFMWIVNYLAKRGFFPFLDPFLVDLSKQNVTPFWEWLYSFIDRSMELYHEQEQHVRTALVICATELAGGLLLLNILKYFEVMLKILEFSHVKEIVESWLVYGNKFLWII